MTRTESGSGSGAGSIRFGSAPPSMPPGPPVPTNERPSHRKNDGATAAVKAMPTDHWMNCFRLIHGCGEAAG